MGKKGREWGIVEKKGRVGDSGEEIGSAVSRAILMVAHVWCSPVEPAPWWGP